MYLTKSGNQVNNLVLDQRSKISTYSSINLGLMFYIEVLNRMNEAKIEGQIQNHAMVTNTLPHFRALKRDVKYYFRTSKN